MLTAFVALRRARHLCAPLLDEVVLAQQAQGELTRMSLLDLFPGSPPLVGEAAWLETAKVDAGCARDGVGVFECYADLLANSSATLLAKVWQPKVPNFPAVDGVTFFECVEPGPGRGPRVGDLVAVLLQRKYKVKVDVTADVQESCQSVAELGPFGVDRSWAHRVAFVLLSYREVHRTGEVDFIDMNETDAAILVDGADLGNVFGLGLYALVAASPLLFGAQVIDPEGAT